MLAGACIIGTASCKKAGGEAATTGEATETAAAVGQSFAVDTQGSTIMWEGSKPAGTHAGTIQVSQGTVAVEDGNVTGGEFTIDMNSINVTDLEGDGKANLEAHLKGSDEKGKDDFFNVSTYPTAKFAITKVTTLINNPDATHMVYGNLTMKDVTKEVGFKANINVSDTGVTVETPQFTIDRTQWGIKYGSKTFFDDLKDKFINDDMGIKINLKATGTPS